MTPGGFGEQAVDRRREALAESNPVAAHTQPSLTSDDTTPLASENAFTARRGSNFAERNHKWP